MDNSDEHNDYIVHSSNDQTTIEFMDSDDNDGDEGTGDDSVVDTWDKLPDSVIIRRTIYGPDTSPYTIATLGNMGGSIFSDKIKTLNPGTWLNDEVLDFLFGLILQSEKSLRKQNPTRKSFFIFKTSFMFNLLDGGMPDDCGMITFSKVKTYTCNKKEQLIYLISTKYLSPSTINIFIGFM